MSTKTTIPCSIEGCIRPTLARSWCHAHYELWRRNGIPATQYKPTRVERFWARVDPCRTDGCALWLGRLNRDGYGAFGTQNDSTRLAHHFLIGKPPEGKEWDHVRARGCTHRECVWPEHLEAVTPQVNQARRAQTITHCPHGHEYTLINTRVKNGSRNCRTCERDRMRRNYVSNHA